MQDDEVTLKQIMDSALDAIVCIDTSGVITFWNPQAERIFGWKKEELMGKNLADTIIPERYREQHKKGMNRYLETGDGVVLNRLLEIAAVDQHGKEFPVELTIKPLNQNGQVTFCAFIRDISERKKTEEELKVSEQKYYDLINTIDVIVWEVDVRTFQFTYVSSQAEKLMGYPIERWINEPTFWADHIHPDDRDWAVDYCTQATKKMGSYTFEYRMIAADDRVVWFRDVVTVIIENGQPSRLRGILMDVTESRKLEEAYRTAEERYRSIFENATEGIYQTTPEGKFITANNSLAKMFGYNSSEDLISSISNIGAQFYADQQDRLQMKNLIEKDGKAIGFEFRGVKKNGEIIWVRDHIRAIYDKEGMIKYYEGTLEDISERKAAEEKLVAQLEALQKTNYELDHFVYSVSHDLRAPVATVLGLISIAEMERLTPSSKRYIEMIHESINRMDGFIKDILDYSRNSRLDVVAEKINFREILNETQNSLKVLSGSDKIKIDIKIDDRVAFYSDSTRVGVILKNLFANAIKYQDVNKSSLLRIHIVTSSEKACITFDDNGIGIEQNRLEKIFDMFYRGSNKSMGAGLGLYITKETLAKLGGTIKVQSTLGEFTNFEVCIRNLAN